MSARFKIQKFDWRMNPERDGVEETNCPLDLCIKVLKLAQKNECFMVFDNETGRTITSSVEKQKKESFDYIRVTK